MATSEGCCYLTGAMLNLAAEAADRARIHIEKATAAEREEEEKELETSHGDREREEIHFLF
jgi:F0F1-type ATP synthase epsilon subunit